MVLRVSRHADASTRQACCQVQRPHNYSRVRLWHASKAVRRLICRLSERYTIAGRVLEARRSAISDVVVSEAVGKGESQPQAAMLSGAKTSRRRMTYIASHLRRQPSTASSSFTNLIATTAHHSTAQWALFSHCRFLRSLVSAQ